MEYILIDENNIIIEMFETDNIEKIKKQSIYKPNYKIELKKSYHFKGLNLNRVVNDIVLSNKEAIENGLIKLKDNEVLINDNIIKLEQTQKVVDNEVVEKTNLEKYNEGLITKEEYNAYIVNQRQSEYTQNLDRARAELLDSVLNNLASQGLLNETQMEALKNIQTTRANIKEQYPKQS